MLTLTTSTEVKIFFDRLSKRIEIDSAKKTTLSEMFDTWKETIEKLREKTLR